MHLSFVRMHPSFGSAAALTSRPANRHGVPVGVSSQQARRSAIVTLGRFAYIVVWPQVRVEFAYLSARRSSLAVWECDSGESRRRHFASGRALPRRQPRALQPRTGVSSDQANKEARWLSAAGCVAVPVFASLISLALFEGSAGPNRQRWSSQPQITPTE
jgi:hypothetical protein